MRHFDWAIVSDREDALARPKARRDAALADAVRSIVDDVAERGWSALAAHALRIDGCEPYLVEVAPYAEKARRTLDVEVQAAMHLAAQNIDTFHRRTFPADVEVLTQPGLSVSKVWRPIESAGLYVPGGTAPLFSTLLMLAIPARVAGVSSLTVMTPPRTDGELDPAIALAAQICGIEGIWAVGGAQAIAALAFGAGPIPAVNRICGPGNAWVAVAKAIVSALPGGPGIDVSAGPSELMIIADEGADPALIAADLLSQAEHAPDAQVILVSPSSGCLEKVQAAFVSGGAVLEPIAPMRSIRCADMREAVEIANLYAPEHLSLASTNAASLVPHIRNAGAVFVGACAAESFGDYLAGSSHVLPTDGAARFSGGVSTQTFMKAMTVQRISSRAAAALSAPAAALARLEGLEAHARAAEMRAA